MAGTDSADHILLGKEKDKGLIELLKKNGIMFINGNQKHYMDKLAVPGGSGGKDSNGNAGAVGIHFHGVGNSNRSEGSCGGFFTLPST